MGKCKGHSFALIPPRPQTVGRRKSENGEENGSGNGAGPITPATPIPTFESRFQGRTTVSGGQKKQQQQSKPCEGLNPLAWFGCHVQNGWNILTSRVSEATPIPYSPLTGAPILVVP